MAINNYKDFLTEADLLPAAIEAMLPSGAPKISTYLTKATGKLPATPNFPMGLPDLPPVPVLPTLPALPGTAGLPYGGNRRQEARNVGNMGNMVTITPPRTIVPVGNGGTATFMGLDTSITFK